MATTKLQSLHHSVFRLHYHLVLITKYRKKVLTKQMLAFLEDHFRYVLIRWKCALVEFSGEADHAHLLFEARPNLRLSDLVNNLKTTSSRRLRNEFSSYLRQYYWKPVFWHRAYCIISAGAPLDILRQYIQNQDLPA